MILSSSSQLPFTTISAVLRAPLRLEFLHTLLEIKLVLAGRDFELSFLWPTSSPRQHLLITVRCWRQGQWCVSLSNTSAQWMGRTAAQVSSSCLSWHGIHLKTQGKSDWGPSILSSTSPINGCWAEEGSSQLFTTLMGNGEI